MISRKVLESSITWKSQNFDILFLSGYWKKIAFLLDTEAGFELSMAMGDFTSFKIIFLAKKAGINDPKRVQKAIKDDREFSKILKEVKNKDNQNDFAEEMISSAKIKAIFN
jgi:hypothetical protein